MDDLVVVDEGEIAKAAELSQRLANAMATVYEKVQEMDGVIQSVVDTDNKKTEEGKRMFKLVDDATHIWRNTKVQNYNMASERATRQEGFPVKEYWALDQTFGPVSGHGNAIDRDLTIQEMLELGANPNVRDKVTGNTAVHIAAKTLISPLVKVLCSNDFRADVTICNTEGKTPLHVALETKQQIANKFSEFSEDDRRTNSDIRLRTFFAVFVMAPDEFEKNFKFVKIYRFK